MNEIDAAVRCTVRQGENGGMTPSWIGIEGQRVPKPIAISTRAIEGYIHVLAQNREITLSGDALPRTIVDSKHWEKSSYVIEILMAFTAYVAMSSEIEHSTGAIVDDRFFSFSGHLTMKELEKAIEDTVCAVEPGSMLIQ